jgi:uncharacterized protein (TIGR02391 family)
MEQEKLTDEQRLCLQMIFDYFHEHGKWPTYSYLERTFHQRHPELDLDEIVESLPPGLSKPLSAYTFSVIGSANEEAILTVPAIYLCQGAVEDLTDFVQSLRFCGERYYSSDKNDRQVSSSDLISQLGLSSLSARKVGLLFQVEVWMFTSFSIDGKGNWQCRLSREVRKFRDVTTIEQYLAKRAELKSVKQSVAPLTETTQQSIVVTEMGNLEIHPEIYTRCWHLYSARRYHDATLNATKALEVTVRTRAKLPPTCVGVDVFTVAFRPNKPLLRYSNIEPEQEGMISLLRGIIQVFKNPQSHRFAGVQSKADCLAVLLMCSNLLYIVDNAEFVG